MYELFFDVFCRFDIRASGLVLFLFFWSYLLCCICLFASGTSKSFSFNNLSGNFLSVIDVSGFDISNWVLNSGKFPSF